MAGAAMEFCVSACLSEMSAGAPLRGAVHAKPTTSRGSDEMRRALFAISGANALRISVLDDLSGLPGGTVIESATVIGEMTTNSGGSIVMGTFSGANLLGGISSYYWIVVEAEPVTGGTIAVWHVNPDGLSGPKAVRFNGGSWTVAVGPLAAFRVTEPVQVPAISLLVRGVLGTALVLLAVLSLIRRPTTANFIHPVPVSLTVVPRRGAGLWPPAAGIRAINGG
jgi:hypothetical protein